MLAGPVGSVLYTADRIAGAEAGTHGRARVTAVHVFVGSGGRPAAARGCCGTCLRSNSCCPTAASAAVA